MNHFLSRVPLPANYPPPVSTTFNPELMRKIEVGEVLFRLRDGSYLAFAVPWKKGGQSEWTLGQWHNHLVAPVNKTKDNWKRGLGKLGLRTSRTGLFFIAGDFDKLPPEYAHLEKKVAFAMLRLRLTSLLPGHSITICSPSGKAKILVCFYFEGNPLDLSRKDMFAALASVLPPDLVPFLDKNGTALDVVFLYGLDMIGKLSTELARLSPLPFPSLSPIPEEASSQSLDGAAGTGCLVSTSSTHGVRYSLAEDRWYEPHVGDLPAALSDRLNGNVGLDQVVRLLLSAWPLAKSGFAISSKYLAKRLGKFFAIGCHTQPTAYRNLRRLETLGLLKRVKAGRRRRKGPRSARPQWESNIYIAEGAFREAIIDLDKSRAVTAPPTIVGDGEWDVATLQAARYFFPDEGRYLSWARSQPGLWAKRGRVKQVARSFSRAEQYFQQLSVQQQKQREQELLVLITKEGKRDEVG